MTMPVGPYGARPASRFSADSSPWTSANSGSSYPAAALRAAVISLILLVFLAILVIF